MESIRTNSDWNWKGPGRGLVSSYKIAVGSEPDSRTLSKGLLHGFRASRVPLGIDRMGSKISEINENGADALPSEITILDAKTAG